MGQGFDQNQVSPLRGNRFKAGRVSTTQFWKVETWAGKVELESRATDVPPAMYNISVAVGLMLTMRAGFAGMVTGLPIMSIISSG